MHKPKIILAALVAAATSACIDDAYAVVNTTAATQSYNCNGSTTAYPIPFPYLATSDLVVTSTASGVVTTLAINTDFTVSPSSGSSGTVTLTAGVKCPNLATLKIARQVDMKQKVSFRTQGPYSAPAHETALDKLTMEVQQLSGRIDDILSYDGGTAIALYDGGVSQGAITSLNCTGDAITCSVSAGAGTIADTAPVITKSYNWTSETFAPDAGNTAAITAIGHGSGAGLEVQGGATGPAVLAYGPSNIGVRAQSNNSIVELDGASSIGGPAAILMTANSTHTGTLSYTTSDIFDFSRPIRSDSFDSSSVTTLTVGVTNANGLTLGASSYYPVMPGGLLIGPGKVLDTYTGGSLGVGTGSATSLTLGAASYSPTFPGGATIATGKYLDAASAGQNLLLGSFLKTAFVQTDSGGFWGNSLDAKAAAPLVIGTTNATGVTIVPATTITGALTSTGGVISNSLDGRTATTLAIGASTATGVSIGSGSVYVQAPGGYTAGNGHYDTGGGGALTIGPTFATSVVVTPPMTASSAKNKGHCTLGTSCASITVTSGSECTCADNTSAAACKVVVSGTTLTLTGTGTDVISYLCF